jgi:hypothetical protein
MRNLHAKTLREGRHVEPRRRPTQEEILEEAFMQDQLLDEQWDEIEIEEIEDNDV